MHVYTRFALKICGLVSNARPRKESREGREELLERSREFDCKTDQVFSDANLPLVMK